MHIKKVVISNFKSYREDCHVDPFSPGLNVVVGRNGTGKSNFFKAIEFVLSDKFTNLRQEDRKKLLHEGAGSNALNAFVEIHFDNSDERLPVTGKTVKLRREIGLKKDTFYLNGKQQKRSQINDLLESAGFSRSNPYYIVQQGKVQALVQMTATERLALLEEVAGTKVYEDRRAQSLQILKQTDLRREKISEVIQNIEEKLQTLEEEKNDLQQYIACDKKERAIKHCIHTLAHDDALKKLAENEDEYSKQNREAKNRNDEKLVLEDQVREKEAAARKLESELARLNKEKSIREAEWASMGKTREDAILEVKKLEDACAQAELKGKELLKERKQLEPEIRKTRKQIEETIAPQIEEQQEARDETDSALREKELEKAAIENKTGRAVQFDSKQERDEWLEAEIPKREKIIRNMEQNIRAKEAKVKKKKKTITGENKKLKQKQKALAKADKDASAVSKTKHDLETQKNKLLEDKKAHWRRGDEVEREIKTTIDTINNAKRTIFRTCPRDIANGLEHVQMFVKNKKLTGAHGPLFELFKVKNPKFRTAVETIAHNSLFNYVVDTDQLAARLITELEKRFMGRVTFMPLNKLKKRNFTYPPKAAGVIPLVSRLAYDAKYEDAVMQIFGKILVCRDLKDASKIARQYRMPCVTLQGERVEPRGGMDGGYWDPSTSRLAAVKTRDDNRAKLVELEAEQKEINQTTTEIEQSVTKILGEIRILEEQHSDLKILQNDCRSKIKTLMMSVKDAERAIQRQSGDLKAMRDRHGDLDAEIRTMQEELGTELQDELSDQDLAKLKQLKQDIAQLNQKSNARRGNLEKLKAQEAKCRHHLSNNLEKRMFEIEQLLSSGAGSTSYLKDQKEALRRAQARLTQCDAEAEAAKKETAALTAQINQVHDSQRTADAELEEVKGELEDVTDALNEYQQDMERLMKRGMLLREKADSARRDSLSMGSLPSKELKEYKSIKSRKTLDNALKRAQKEKKKYEGVNKKALDQFVNYSDQRKSLLVHVREIDASKQAIDKLIETLDQRKDEAINRTFTDVAGYFEAVFKELVPDGHGTLELVQAEVDADSEDRGRQLEYTGINMKVKFAGKTVTKQLAKLSGGQRAVVALALIFAIQRCDPAPFYLFDEIDQALDATHRHKVAALIHKQANSDEASCQFITSTFRPECVEVANKCYGIKFQHKVSRAVTMSKKDALEFIEKTQNDTV